MASTYKLRASTCASSSSSSAQYRYDVFLSFRGEDTRKKFTDHLYDKLEWRGIKTFRDDPDLPRGTSISPALLAAIKHSRFAVVVLSPNYASSKWCLLELVEIIQCMGDRGTILPVFYEVDPSDVRHQKGSFAEAFAEHQEKFGEDSNKVQEWRGALTKVASLSGWTSKDYGYETKLIEEIVETIWKKVHPAFALSESDPLENLFGIDSKLMEIEYLLESEADDVSFIGIWGMGGIGKTTLARLVYQRTSYHFEFAIFLADVRQVSATHGLVHVQKQLLCQILKEKNVEVRDVYDGMTKTKRCLFNKKVLLVLDDVDQLDQLEMLAGGKDWFGSGSIIMITTRDQRLLVSHDIVKQYKSKGLNEYEALRLFCWKAFKKDYPEEGYMELCESILDYSRGLPSALKILGSFLYKRDRGDWESTVANLKKVPVDQVLFTALRISYDGLNEMEKQVFLSVSCFLKGSDKERVIQILDSVFGFDSRIMISVLIEKSLLNIFDECIDMHDLIQEMGMEIVRLESAQEPGKRSHLWLRDDIFHVLKENMGTEAIRSITICLPQVEELDWNPNAFSKMSKLMLIRIQNLVLRQGPEYLPDEMRILEWTSYPSDSLPLYFQPVNLVELILHHSKIRHLWHGIKYLNKLTIIDLSYSKNLTETPDFTGIPFLERLILEGCSNLVYIHPSITSLRRLKILNFKDCQSINSFPGELETDSLVLIDLSGCSKVTILPQLVGRIQKIPRFFLDGIGKQVSCNSVRPHRLNMVLASLKHFCSLKGLYLNHCKLGEGAIPDDIGCLSSLEDLDLSANNFFSLPASIHRLSKLKCLYLADCRRLQELPDLPLFDGTCHLTVDNCKSLIKFAYAPEFCRLLWKLSFSFINCCRITKGRSEVDSEDGGSSYIIYSMLQRFLQEPPPYFEMFSIVIPGNDIPKWFKYQNVSDRVMHLPQDCSSCSSKWMGFALCVLVGPEENAVSLAGGNAQTISCSWKPGHVGPACFSVNLNQVVKSDHLCVVLLPSKHYPEYNLEFYNFFFKVEAGLKVKKCGVRTLYKQEVKELGLRMDVLCKRSIHGNHVIRMVQEPELPPVYEMFCSVIPGENIPAWFETRGRPEYLAYQSLPQISCPCRETWIGFAICVVFGAERIFSGLPKSALGQGLLDVKANTICCCLKACRNPDVNFSCDLQDQVVNSSDHLCVFFIPGNKFLDPPAWVMYNFKTSCTRNNAYWRVKGYGFRSLFEQDMEERQYTKNTSQEDRFAEQLIRSIKSGHSQFTSQ